MGRAPDFFEKSFDGPRLTVPLLPIFAPNPLEQRKLSSRFSPPPSSPYRNTTRTTDRERMRFSQHCVACWLAILTAHRVVAGLTSDDRICSLRPWGRVREGFGALASSVNVQQLSIDGLDAKLLLALGTTEDAFWLLFPGTGKSDSPLAAIERGRFWLSFSAKKK